MELKIFINDTSANCYVCTDAGIAYVIDPANHAEAVLAYIKAKQCTLKWIFLTHGHYDHVGECDILIKPYPEAEIFLHPDDYVLLTSNERGGCRKIGQIPLTIASLSKWPRKKMPFTYLHTPGHTAGSSCFYCAELKVLFTGDTIFINDTGRTDLFNAARPKMVDSLKALLEFVAPLELNIYYPGHGEHGSKTQLIRLLESEIAELTKGNF